MSCSKCHDHGVHLTEGTKKLKWLYCSCEVGQLMAGNMNFDAQAQGESLNKYGAKPTERIVNGELLKFASKGEALRWDVLELRQKAGEIRDLKPHPKFELRNALVAIRNRRGSSPTPPTRVTSRTAAGW